MSPRRKPVNLGASSRWWYLPLWLLVVAAGVLATFWLRFGSLDGTAYYTAGLLCLIVIAAHWASTANHAAFESRNRAHKRGPGDVLAVIWLLAFVLAPLAGWLVVGFVDLTPTNWRWRFGIRAFICVVVPIVCVLPMIRYIKGAAAVPTLVFLLAGTLFPVASGWNAAVDYVRGSEWQHVTVTAVRSKAGSIKHTTYTQTDRFVDLADGRTLRHSGQPPFAPGPVDALVLRATKRIIATRPSP